MALPIDLALALAAAGIPIDAPDLVRIVAIKLAIAERRGDIAGPELAENGYRVELLYPSRQIFEGRTETLALS